MITERSAELDRRLCVFRRHGSAVARATVVALAAFHAVAWAGPVDGDGVATIDRRVFAVRIGIDDGGDVVRDVALWFSTDDGANWRRFESTGAGAITESPASTATAASAANEAVDLTITGSIGETALDEPNRENRILFEAPEDGDYGFFAVATNGIGSSTAPPVPGTVPQLRVHVESPPPVVQPIVPLNPPVTPVADQAVRPRTDDSRGSAGAAKVKEAGGSTRAATLRREAKAHVDRGELRLATSRLREALALDPGSTEALVELGGALYAQRLLGEATDAYRLALAQDATSRSALQGLALVHVAEHRFPEAVQQLSAMVRANPRDVEAWLYLGDVAIYQGDELLAREQYQKASTLDPRATEIIDKAQLRLGSLQRLAASFRQVEPTP